jgi:PIN domain nuclease of toxin-antitoxin system
VNLLLDTHFVIWLATDTGRINRAERAVLAKADNALIVSVISLWEIRIKWNTLDRFGNRKGELSPEAAVELATDRNMQLVSLLPDDVIARLVPPPAHRDPFDEMLLMHAQKLDAKLLTRDRDLLEHPLALQL